MKKNIEINNFNQLKKYAENMRMSHIYQPVMIKTLLLNDGNASKREIGEALLSYDESQIEYYSERTERMVGKVLRQNKVVSKDKKIFSLIAFEDIKKDKSKIEEIINICDKKIDAYVKKRGEEIWAHRNYSRKNIKGSDRYEVLKRAKYRCELCGSPEKHRALEVDHIIPKSIGGPDEISNYQALCYKCNALKGNKDDTDFRKISDSYNDRNDSCIFCNIPKKRIVDENELCYSIKDNFPVVSLHTLIIPKRHINNYFKLYQPEINSIQQLLTKAQSELKKYDNKITGFNVGINNGEDAGQTIMHTHVHLIPRRKGDVPDPIGGVRGVIPSKQKYKEFN